MGNRVEHVEVVDMGGIELGRTIASQSIKIKTIFFHCSDDASDSRMGEEEVDDSLRDPPAFVLARYGDDEKVKKHGGPIANEVWYHERIFQI